MHDVFISYSSVNKQIADAVCHRLESGNIKCWYAPRDIAVGEDWPAAIVNAIEHSRVFVLIYSKDSNQSKEVLREVMTAADSNCVIIPFRMDESQMDQGLAYYLKAVHWLDAISPPLDAKLDLLYRRVHSILNPVIGRTEPKPETPKKQPRPKRWILGTCLVLTLVLLAFTVLPMLNPPSPKDTVQTISMHNLSHTGLYRYPFFSSSMISAKLDAYFVEDTLTGEFAYLKIDTGHPIFEELSHSFQDLRQVSAAAMDNFDVIYFIDSAASSVRIFDKDACAWVTEEAIPLELTSGEMVTAFISCQDYKSSGQEHKDEMILLVFDGRTQYQCISRAITLSPDGSKKSTDLSSYGLISYLSGLDKPGSNEVLMLDRNNQPRLLDVVDLTLRDVPVQTILDEYMPYKADDYATISADGRYAVSNNWNAGSHTIYVLDFKEGGQVFSETFTQNFNREFLGDHELLIYNQENSSVYVYDLLTGRKTIKMDEQYFRDNPYFPEIPFIFFYIDSLEACIFVAAANEGAAVRLIMTDIDGTVLAQSDPVDVPFSEYSVELMTGDDAVFLLLSSYTESEIDSNNGVCTELFRADFSFDSEGNLLFGD